jgi:hypothetical protein
VYTLQARLGEGVSGSSDSSPIVLSSQRNSPLDFTQQREQVGFIKHFNIY